MNNKVEVSIRLFPAAYPIDKVYHPLLNVIARAHPETFARFNPRPPRVASSARSPWSVDALAQLRFGDFTPATETALREVTQDLAELGFDLGWLSARDSALRAAGSSAAWNLELFRSSGVHKVTLDEPGGQACSSQALWRGAGPRGPRPQRACLWGDSVLGPPLSLFILFYFYCTTCIIILFSSIKRAFGRCSFQLLASLCLLQLMIANFYKRLTRRPRFDLL